jgi:hypothetical protein
MNKIILLLTVLTVISCKKSSDDAAYSVDTTAEMGQQIGDAMVSVDESGGSSSGAIANNEVNSSKQTYARYTNEENNFRSSVLDLAIPKAEAAACSTVAFAACSTNQRVRDFAGCTFGVGGVMTGNVTLNFTGTGAGTCTIPAASDAVSRVPNFTLTGLRGASFAVTATSTGQTVTRSGATTFTFANSGIRRKFTTPAGSVILDLTTSTSSPITVTGNSRTSRTMTGGALTMLNNLTSVSCSVSPSAITWGASCNCPTSGSWSGSCSDSTTFTVAFTSTCGQATVTKGTETSTVTMDRCL